MGSPSTNTVKPAEERVSNVLIILPTFNEAGNIGALCEHLMAVEPPVDVVVVDDDSPDGTADIAGRVAQSFPNRIIVEKRKERLGRGNAVMHGFRYALANHYDYCLEMDADFSHDPNDIPRFIDVMDDADLVIGSRNIAGGGVRGWGWKRRALHTVASWYARLLLGRVTSDQTNGFRMYRVSTLVTLPLESVTAEGYVGQTLRAFMYQREGKRVKDIPVVFHERRAGTSKMSSREAIYGAWALLWYRLRHR